MSAWLEHVKKTMKLHPGKPLKDVLKAAKATYKKAEDVAEYAITGKKARRTGKKSGKSKKGGAKKSRKTAKKSRKMRRSRKH